MWCCSFAWPNCGHPACQMLLLWTFPLYLYRILSLLSYSFWLDHRHWDKDNWNYTLQGAGPSLPFVLALVCYWPRGTIRWMTRVGSPLEIRAEGGEVRCDRMIDHYFDYLWSVAICDIRSLGNEFTSWIPMERPSFSDQRIPILRIRHLMVRPMMCRKEWLVVPRWKWLDECQKEMSRGP